MKNQLRCCTQCQVYWTCETKWYRGERGEENICCNVCNFYEECLDKSRQVKKGQNSSKG